MQSLTAILSAENDTNFERKKQTAISQTAVIKRVWTPVFKWNNEPVDNQVFISFAVIVVLRFNSVLSAAHFNSDKPCCIIRLDTTTLAHGDGLFSVRLGSALLHSVFLTHLISTYMSWKEGRAVCGETSVSFHSCLFRAVISRKAGLLFHYNTHLFIALNSERWCCGPFTVFRALPCDLHGGRGCVTSPPVGLLE